MSVLEVIASVVVSASVWVKVFDVIGTFVERGALVLICVASPLTITGRVEGEAVVITTVVSGSVVIGAMVVTFSELNGV